MARIRRGLNIEKKFFDTAINFTVDATGEVPATGQLNLIPQGVTESTRVGRTCQLKSIQFRAQVRYDPGTDTRGSTTAYILLVQDRQANGAAAAITDVMTGNDLATAMINMANSERFKIVRRWVVHLDAEAGVAAAYSTSVKDIDDYIKINTSVEFSSTTGAITEIKSNNYFLLASTGVVTTDDAIAVVGTCRMRFTDM